MDQFGGGRGKLDKRGVVQRGCGLPHRRLDEGAVGGGRSSWLVAWGEEVLKVRVHESEGFKPLPARHARLHATSIRIGSSSRIG